ncbi:YbhB/YbcL family Raf kinase inhibitor-like protein [Flavihumibacter profundi]|jgi:Raf kinase inhibitor-like YbhB/YbcL family protein|uniref:YbhB/YbcL family Raf kinase inhibitor-like protein n=1 Tax=Flavihumibacter profundi TaxID=2716883 RepID=UPI001CC6F34A|nr:YbhB/YbcL family Raf kinase inhibitor-like protein [Flavihumibacter profundi]MBZ5857632.1 YbhB/YbcL family Raf kinase inhibitor-like protein [Flavihumibacter profundi]
MKQSTKAVDYKVLAISSAAFADNGMIPSKYTCDGIDVNPPLQVDDIPHNAKHLAIIVDDPDAPGGTWVHWVSWNMPVSSHIKENTATGDEGVNDFGNQGYNGPCPPPGTHHYHFKVYALDDTLDLPARADKAKLEHAMAGHILAFGELVGLYSRKR